MGTTYDKVEFQKGQSEACLPLCMLLCYKCPFLMSSEVKILQPNNVARQRLPTQILGLDKRSCGLRPRHVKAFTIGLIGVGVYRNGAYASRWCTKNDRDTCARKGYLHPAVRSPYPSTKVNKQDSDLVICSDQVL